MTNQIRYNQKYPLTLKTWEIHNNYIIDIMQS